MTPIRFSATAARIRDWTIIRLPESASSRLPSRGMALVEGTINDNHAKIVLEPDGMGGHWFRVDAGLPAATAGERRPCCFNRNACTEPEVSRDGVLIAPA